MKYPFRTGMAAAALVLLAATGGWSGHAQAQRVATPEARSFGIRTDDGNYLTIGAAEALPGGSPHARIGFLVRCGRASPAGARGQAGKLEAWLSFGSAPAGKRVQAAAGHPEGKVERFGPVMRGGGAAAGFHSPMIAGREDVLRFVDAAFVTGALVSNGHNSVWNRIGEAENREARAALRRCAGAGG